jgi:hypothetical protein
MLSPAGFIAHFLHSSLPCRNERATYLRGDQIPLPWVTRAARLLVFFALGSSQFCLSLFGFRKPLLNQINLPRWCSDAFRGRAKHKWHPENHRRYGSPRIAVVRSHIRKSRRFRNAPKNASLRRPRGLNQRMRAGNFDENGSASQRIFDF